MKGKLVAVALGLATLVLAGSANADHQAEDHKGFFIQTGMKGSIDLDLGDNRRLLDMGPGVMVGLGYNMGIIGYRASFNYANMDGRSPLGNFGFTTDLYTGALELKISPLGETDNFIQPYLVAGAGASYFEGNIGNASAGDWGFTGNGGVGLDIFLVDGLAITLETNIRPSVFYRDPKPAFSNNSYDVYFYDFMGGLTYVFGSSAEAAPAPAPAPAAAPAPKKAPAPQKIDLRGEINFKTNSDEILASSFPYLDEAVMKMKNHPEIEVVRIEGHTDSRGNDAYNMDLSQRRANSVKTYFVGKGIAGSRLNPIGYGESKPIADNTTPEGLAKNRRIDFFIEKMK